LSEHNILQVVKEETVGGEEEDNRLFEPVSGSELLVERIPCYHPMLQRIVDRNYGSESVFLLEIPLSELVEWNATRGGDLAQRATDNTLRYHALFCSVVDQHLKGLEPTAAGAARNAATNGTQLRDTLDILQQHREAAQERARQENNQQPGDEENADGVEGDAAVNGNNATNRNPGVTQDFPPQLMRRYELRILPVGRRGTLFPFTKQYLPPKLATTPPAGVSLRHVRSKSMGRLVTITGMVVRATDVKPFCQVATYTCDACGVEVYQPLNNQREFMPQRFCPATCAQRGNSNPSLQLQSRGSKFVKFQELKVQELPSQVPMGHVPRSLSVYCRGELTRQANPGDVITVDGVFLPQKVAEGGYRAMKAGLMATLFVDAQHVQVHKKSMEESLLDGLGEEESARLDADIRRVSNSDDPVGILGRSIAPEIFGHADIKRALLLQLTGGVCRKMQDGMSIRGDINICLMGDPGVAKSQLLKHVASIAPRGVYTTGKGSSGVGLTAAVTKDTVTGEMSLEGGALVLADRGICAIVSRKKEDGLVHLCPHAFMVVSGTSHAVISLLRTNLTKWMKRIEPLFMKLWNNRLSVLPRQELWQL
jgi:DNA replication licensing factor MCM7